MPHEHTDIMQISRADLNPDYSTTKLAHKSVFEKQVLQYRKCVDVSGSR